MVRGNNQRQLPPILLANGFQCQKGNVAFNSNTFFSCIDVCDNWYEPFVIFYCSKCCVVVAYNTYSFVVLRNLNRPVRYIGSVTCVFACVATVVGIKVDILSDKRVAQGVFVVFA